MAVRSIDNILQKVFMHVARCTREYSRYKEACVPSEVKLAE